MGAAKAGLLLAGVGDLFGVDLVRGAGWLGAAMKGADALADGLVGGGDALARAEVVEP